MPVHGLVTNGWIVVFAKGPDGALGHMLQRSRLGTWSEWETVGPSITGRPAMSHNPDGRVEVFARGPDGALGHLWQTEFGGDWSDWEELGPSIAGDPVMFHNVDGHLEVFGRGPEGALGHTWQTEPDQAWSDWADIGPEISSDPAVFQNADGRLEVFAAGPGGLLGHMWQLGPTGDYGWSEWEELGPAIQGNPPVFANPEGHLEVFGIGPEGLLGHRWQVEPHYGWSDWADLGPEISSNPAVFQNAGGRLEVFARGPDGLLGHIWQNEPDLAWSAWESLGPEISGDPAVFQNADGRLEVFAVGPEGLLGHRWQHEVDGTNGWSGWEDLGPAISGPPAVGQSGSVDPPKRGDEDVAEAESARAARPMEVVADFCVIGAGPAGITVADGLVRAGAKVILVESGNLQVDPRAQELNEGHADGPVIKGRDTYLRDGRHRGVQGSAIRWGPAWCMAFRAIDFTERPWVRHSGWPLTAEDLVPYESRAARTFAIDDFPPPRPEGPLVKVAYQFPPDSLVFRAMYVDLLPKAGFHPELGATAVELKVKGERIDSVRVVRTQGGELNVKAGTVVLAAGGIENARMLLLHERTLASSAMTGRCFMEHPHVLAGTVHLPDAAPLRSCIEQVSQWDVLALDDTTQSRENLLNAGVQLRPHDGGATLEGPVACDLFVRAEQAPNPDSQLVLGEETDWLGCARPVLHWRVLEQDWDSIVRTAEGVAFELQRRFGAEVHLSISRDAPWPGDPADPAEETNSAWGNHHMGTTRMADTHVDGVVDRNCLLHGTPNLYVAGSSVFPTGGCANPTFMIVALAHRLVDHLTQSGATP